MLKHYARGAFFGELALSGHGSAKRAASVVATEATRCLKLCVADFADIKGPPAPPGRHSASCPATARALNAAGSSRVTLSLWGKALKRDL